jgi:hypothetical protein
LLDGHPDAAKFPSASKKGKGIVQRLTALTSRDVEAYIFCSSSFINETICLESLSVSVPLRDRPVMSLVAPAASASSSSLASSSGGGGGSNTNPNNYASSSNTAGDSSSTSGGRSAVRRKSSNILGALSRSNTLSSSHLSAADDEHHHSSSFSSDFAPSLPNLPAQSLAAQLEALRFTVQKRISTITLLKRAHGGKHHWFSTVLLSRDELDVIFDNAKMSGR